MAIVDPVEDRLAVRALSRSAMPMAGPPAGPMTAIVAQLSLAAA
ncbi:MAG: hypothetical protein WCZ66_06155 [Sphingomonadaceae bacterium]